MVADTVIDSTVEYRDIPGYPGYRAGSDGSVWSFARWNRWAKLTNSMGNHGYLITTMNDSDGKRVWRTVHSLIAAAFIGPRPAGFDCCHNDGDRTNNLPINLRYATRKENNDDKYRHGTDRRGEKTPTSKLCTEDIIAIFMLAEGGMSQRHIAPMFDICQQTVSDILNKRRWGHLDHAKLLRDHIDELMRCDIAV